MLSLTIPQQSLRVQKLYMHACMVIPVMLDRMTRTAWLSASHYASPGLPPRRRLQQRARCYPPSMTTLSGWLMFWKFGYCFAQIRLFCSALSVCRNFMCMLVYLYGDVCDVG